MSPLEAYLNDYPLAYIEMDGLMASSISESKPFGETEDMIMFARAAIDTTRSQGLNPDLEIIIVQHEETPDEGNLQRGSKEWKLVFPPRANDEYERLVSKNVRTSPSL